MFASSSISLQFIEILSDTYLNIVLAVEVLCFLKKLYDSKLI